MPWLLGCMFPGKGYGNRTAGGRTMKVLGTVGPSAGKHHPFSMALWSWERIWKQDRRRQNYEGIGNSRPFCRETASFLHDSLVLGHSAFWISCTHLHPTACQTPVRSGFDVSAPLRAGTRAGQVRHSPNLRCNQKKYCFKTIFKKITINAKIRLNKL